MNPHRHLHIEESHPLDFHQLLHHSYYLRRRKPLLDLEKLDHQNHCNRSDIAWNRPNPHPRIHPLRHHSCYQFDHKNQALEDLLKFRDLPKDRYHRSHLHMKTIHRYQYQKAHQFHLSSHYRLHRKFQLLLGLLKPLNRHSLRPIQHIPLEEYMRRR